MKKEIIIGIIVICAILLAVWGINYLKGRGVFKKEKEFYALYDRVDGLVIANPVQLNGYKIGQVSDIYFHPDNSGRIVVKFFIKNTDFKIPKNTIAKIISTDLMGTKAIELFLGEDTVIIGVDTIVVGYAGNGDTLHSYIVESLTQEVSKELAPLKAKAEAMLVSIDSVMAVVQNIFNEQSREYISKSLGSIKSTIEHLERTTITLDTLLTQQRGRLVNIIGNIESITYNLKENNEKINAIVDNFHTISDTLAKAQIAETFSEAKKALKDFTVITDKINRGEGSLGLLIQNDTLYNELESASKNLDLLLEDLRLNPNRYMNFSIFGRKKPYKQPEIVK